MGEISSLYLNHWGGKLDRPRHISDKITVWLISITMYMAAVCIVRLQPDTSEWPHKKRYTSFREVQSVEVVMVVVVAAVCVHTVSPPPTDSKQLCHYYTFLHSPSVA